MCPTPDRWQSKTFLTIDEREQKIARKSGDKGHSKILFLTIFYLRSSIVLTLSIATDPVCVRSFSLPRDAVSWSVACDCCISWSYWRASPPSNPSNTPTHLNYVSLLCFC